MRPTESLWADHETLRSQLTLLEENLRLADGACFPMRDAAFFLAGCLSAHMEHEEHFLIMLQEAQSEPPGLSIHRLLEEREEHEDYRLTVTLLLELLNKEQPTSMDPIILCATHLIDGLRKHMAREEVTLFPVIDRFIGEERRGSRRIRGLLKGGNYASHSDGAVGFADSRGAHLLDAALVELHSSHLPDHRRVAWIFCHDQCACRTGAHQRQHYRSPARD